MQKAHSNQNWENKPSINTPLNQTNLNKLDRSVDLIDDRVVAMDTTKANQTDMLQTISNITFNKQTGVFTVTRYNGTSFTIDTDLEKIAINFDYDDNPSSPHYENLIITLIDGTVKYIDMRALITQYEFVDSNQIHFTVEADGKISASIINGSITEVMLEPNFLANCRTEVSKATQQANLSNGYREESESWANGKRNGVDVPDTDPAYQNNAKHYATVAGNHASNAAGSATSASTSASNAATSESNAATSASNASSSETNAAESESNAASSATSASESESNAATSARNAATSETNAASSETNAAQSASDAEYALTIIQNIISGVRPNTRGDWDPTEQYEVLDIVYHNGISWMARRQNTNVEPVDGDDWQVFAVGNKVYISGHKIIIEGGN